MKKSAGVIAYRRREREIEIFLIVSNTFEMMWPPKSGQRKAFAELDRAAWFAPLEARQKLISGQLPVLDDFLENHLNK
ncbi:MAG: hypothetical protein AAF610_03675 [Pseudomonadota bacterium]